MRSPLMDKSNQEETRREEQLKTAVGISPDCGPEDATNHSKCSEQAENQTNTHSKIQRIILAPFSESNKEILQNILNDTTNLSSTLLASLVPIFSSPYFHFFSSKLRALLFKALLIKTSLPNESRLLAAELIQLNFCPVEAFCDSLALYSSLDPFRTGRVSFRNSFILRLLTAMLDSGIPPDNSFSSLSTCPAFLDFLTKNSTPSAATFLILYSFYFLRSIKPDLLTLTSQDHIKHLDDSVISRIFSTFQHIYDILMNDSSQIYTPLVITAFNSTSLKSILLSIYKRLFFFFLFKNRRIFYSIKVFNVFTKDERSFIYKTIKKHTSAFINIFKQIDQEYLIKKMKADARRMELGVSEDLLLSVKEERLGPGDLADFYSYYFLYLENNRKALKIKGKNLEVFSIEFNKRLDKSFVRFIYLESKVISYTVNTLRFIYYFTLINSSFNSQSSNQLVLSLIDPVELVSLLVDQSDFTNTEYVNFVLQIIYNIFILLNQGLLMRVLPAVRKLLIYKEYMMNAGRIYNRIYQKYKFMDPLYDSSIEQKSSSSILIMASINHPQFMEHYHSTLASSALASSTLASSALASSTLASSTLASSTLASSTLASSAPLQSSTSLTSDLLSLVFYINFNPDFSLSFPFIADILTLPFSNPTKENISLTNSFLTLLSLNISQCSSFITKNIRLILDLFFYSQNASFIFESLILHILLLSLKSRLILPCMAVPYISIRNDSIFIYKNYIDSCINCINDSIYVLCKRIRILLMNGENENIRDLSFIKEIFDKELNCNFIYLSASRISMKKTIERINYQNDRLVVYVVLRYLRDFGRKEKEFIIKQINESVGEDGIFEMVEKTRIYYEREPRGKLPVEYLFEG